MPYQVDFDANNRILRARFIGRVTDDELRNMYRFGQENVARFDPLSGITDFSELTAVAFSPQTMRDLARTKPIMPDPSRPVIFIVPTPDLFGMGRTAVQTCASCERRRKPTRSSTFRIPTSRRSDLLLFPRLRLHSSPRPNL